MPSKKKKYNSRFPPARIKKIMQTDDEVGKVAAAVPVLISKCLEMFLVSILQHTGEVTKVKRAKTMSTSHLKECIMNVSMFDFLKDVVASVPDMQNEEEPSTSNSNVEQKKTVRKRNLNLPKTPKKRAKLGKTNTEDNEGSDAESEEELNQGSSNGALSSSMSSAGHQSPSNVDDQKSSIDNDAKEVVHKSTSFHIPLDDLMSPEKGTLIKNEEVKIENNTAPTTVNRDPSNDSNSVPNAKQGTENVELHKNNDSAIDMTMSKVSIPNTPARCGVIVTNSSISTAHKNIVQQTAVVQPGLNLHNKSTTQHKSSDQKPDIKLHIPPPTAAISQSHLGSPHIMPSPLHMPHLYSPLPPIPNLPNTRTEGPHKIPPPPAGSMLNFLYSPYHKEEASNFALPPTRFSEAQSRPRVSANESTKTENKIAPPYSNIRLLYPYNPVDEHYKRMALAAPHNPYPTMVKHYPGELTPGNDGARHQLPPPPPIAKKVVDDDDYDA